MAAFVCNVLVFASAEVEGDAARAGDVFQAGIALAAIAAKLDSDREMCVSPH